MFSSALSRVTYSHWSITEPACSSGDDAAKAVAGTGGAVRPGSASSTPSSHLWVRFSTAAHFCLPFPPCALGPVCRDNTVVVISTLLNWLEITSRGQSCGFLMGQHSLAQPEKWKSRRWGHWTPLSGHILLPFLCSP